MPNQGASVGPPSASTRANTRESASWLSVRAPLPLGVYLRRPVPTLPFPLEEPTAQLFSKARYALWHGLHALGLQEGDELLMPAYHCGLEVAPVLRAGLVCRFYDTGPAIGPDPDQLEELLGPRSRALYLIHYLGFPQDSRFWLEWCRERGLLLIEDAAQAWLSRLGDRPLGSFGDLAIFSLAKTVGVPDGGVVVGASPPHRPSPRRRLGTGAVLDRHTAWLLSRSAWLAAMGRRLEHGPPLLPPDEEYASGDVDAAMATLTRTLLPRLLRHDPAARRRRNYQYLLGELGEHVPGPFAQLPDGACPSIFPIQSPDKAALILRLKSKQVRALNFWAFPHPALPTEAFPGAGRLREGIVGVPVHQELRLRDLEHIVAAVRSAIP
jgi:dTDP-4-amino-4,6-dideoxygalactose transaminase